MTVSDFQVAKSANANVVATADKVRELIPEIKRWIPADIDIAIMSDRTTTIRASLAEVPVTGVSGAQEVGGLVGWNSGSVSGSGASEP